MDPIVAQIEVGQWTFHVLVPRIIDNWEVWDNLITAIITNLLDNNHMWDHAKLQT
jgi:hypothetical protein